MYRHTRQPDCIPSIHPLSLSRLPDLPEDILPYSQQLKVRIQLQPKFPSQFLAGFNLTLLIHHFFIHKTVKAAQQSKWININIRPLVLLSHGQTFHAVSFHPPAALFVLDEACRISSIPHSFWIWTALSFLFPSYLLSSIYRSEDSSLHWGLQHRPVII